MDCGRTCPIDTTANWGRSRCGTVEYRIGVRSGGAVVRLYTQKKIEKDASKKSREMASQVDFPFLATQ